MGGRIIIAIVLATASVAGNGQEVARGADGPRAIWPHMHQCTLAPPSRLAIKTKGTGAQRIRVGDLDGDGWSRIDLRLAGSPDGSGGPTISAHAINTKGTGASGRMSGSDMQGRVEVACVTSQLAGDDAAQKATMSSFAFMRTDGQGVGWSCSVSGSEEKPVFRIGLLVPTILGQAESAPGKAASWSWGVSNSGVAIVKRSVDYSDSWHVACSSKEPRASGYDLAVMKKV